MQILECELLLGKIDGAPLHMRPNLTGMKEGSFLQMMLMGKETKNPEAQYLYICLFERTGKEVKELSNPNYKRSPTMRNGNHWRPFKGKASSIVIINQKTIMFHQFTRQTLVNYVGICDHTGKLFALEAVKFPFMGFGCVGFAPGKLIIRAS